METKKVVAAIIRKKDKFLIARRNSKGVNANLWEFPGGKVQTGETQKDALVREIKEELALNIKVNDLFCESEWETEKEHIRLVVYNVDILDGEPMPLEHQEIRWVRLEELKKFDWSPADLYVVDRLLSVEKSI